MASAMRASGEWNPNATRVMRRILVLTDSMAGPPDPFLKRRGGLVGGQLEHQAQSFLEEVGPVQPGVGLGDPGQFRLLPGGEVLGVLPQRVPGTLECFRVPGRPAGGAQAKCFTSTLAWRARNSETSRGSLRPPEVVPG